MEKILFVRIFSLFTKRERFELFGIFLLLLAVAFFETLGIGSVFPFISMMTNPGIIHENQILHKIYETLGMTSEQNFFTIFGIGWFIIIAFKNAFSIFSMYVRESYLTKKMASYSSKVYQDYLGRNYNFHLQNNSAMLQHNIQDVDKLFLGYVLPIFQAIPEILIAGSLSALLFYTNFWMTVGALFLVGLPAWIVSFFFGRILKRLGEDYYTSCRNSSKILLEGLINIKEIQVMNRKGFFSLNFFNRVLEVSNIRRKQNITTHSPRLIIETTTLGGLILFVIIMIRSEQTFVDILPTLALFATAAWRLLGCVSKIVGTFNRLKAHQYALNTKIVPDVQQIIGLNWNETLQHIPPSQAPKDFFKHQIRFNKVSFRYQGTNKDVVHQISITIPKGNSIAFVGATGAGKTTLVDIILGLFAPTEGTVYVDEQNIQDDLEKWRKCIGYVPQIIHFSDDTLRYNIAFGIVDELIEEQAILNAIDAAQIRDFIEQLPQGLDTIVGEQGSRLSGGQRQRIAIARALYHDPEILIMDEATSALDGETEAEVIKAINQLSGKKTLIVIAHRLSTVRNCDCIYLMENGKIKDKGNFEELLERNSQFRKMSGIDKDSGSLSMQGS